MLPIIDAGFNKSFQETVDWQASPPHFLNSINETHPSFSSISMPNRERMADICYADSKYSIFIQLADCIAGLRNESLRNSKNESLSEYKAEMLKISTLLDQSKVILHEEHIPLSFSDN